MKKHYFDNERLRNILKGSDAVTQMPKSKFGQQLSLVTQLIHAHQKQIYLVGIKGFDTHNNQKSRHQQLLTELSDGFAALHQHLDHQGLVDQVTAFTMSDFGRRLMANESGTDHGWAGHQIVMGGAVTSTTPVGSWPDLSLTSPYLYKRGRIIPEVATDQVNAHLARWFGYKGNMLKLFPSLVNFPNIPLAF